jgi:hypothetical protein
MRWTEIINESATLTQMARSAIMDILSPLQAQGAGTITVQQVADQLQANPEYAGINIDADFIMNALEGVPRIKIEPDIETNQMSIFIQQVATGRQVDQKTKEKDKKEIDKAALRTIARDRKAD